MPRMLSVWLPRWPILRFLATQTQSPSAPIDPERPFVLVADAVGGPRIVALNEAAEIEDLAVGDTLADARAKVVGLEARAADPDADAAALRRLALWATRYTPAVSPCDEESGGDGFFLDIAGAAHLFGGEELLLADLLQRLARFGLPARLAIAHTPGAAWALSRFHSATAVALPGGQEAEALASLPVEALRLSPDTCATLRRLGFKRIGALIDKPRAPFAARFERELLRRLDQALGRTGEPLVFVVPPPVYHSLRYLLEPVFMQDAIVAITARLMKDLMHALERDGVGARALRLTLYRVDGAVKTVDIALALPTRSVTHVARLIDLKLENLAEDIDAGFGFEALDLAVTTAAPMEDRQLALASAPDSVDQDERLAVLIDRLEQRLSPHSVRRLQSVESYLPERAEILCAVGDTASSWPAMPQAKPRPLLLLPRAEPADVMALVPEGPPRRFRWRGATHRVAWTEGPERIAGEWWRSPTPQPTRDYYLVEDDVGRRFWLYREGLYERETASPRWFVHGLFA